MPTPTTHTHVQVPKSAHRKARLLAAQYDKRGVSGIVVDGIDLMELVMPEAAKAGVSPIVLVETALLSHSGVARLDY